jgi:FixJ family two-component response regulator
MANSTVAPKRSIVRDMAKSAQMIAIVDDDPSVLRALKRLLNARSLHAETYESAHQFLASLPQGLPECLVVDLQMPEMTGLELQHHLMRSGIRIPTIVITAHDETGARERCESAGAIAFLAKPLQDTSLLAAIDAARQLADGSDRRRTAT